MRLLIDVDGVLRNIYQQLIWIYKSEFDPVANISVEDIKEWDISPVFPKVTDPKETFFRRFAREVFLFAPPYPEAPQVMRQLSKDHHIHIVTNQYPGNEHYTIEWLIKWGIPYHSITFTSEKQYIEGDIILDDNLGHIRRVVEKKEPCVDLAVLMERPWSTGYNGLIVRNMEEFGNFVYHLVKIEDLYMEDLYNGSEDRSF